ncbi:hypothetical protein HMPREF1317_1124 [Schaalia georgiae F0490]|uniref:Uncharacterized protein n=1 Tax=Schaalia georgiae F0490 TaxID=1125717 RepID=J0P2A4_9ACTO|nr:hypothetical protein HMPREF1317_1124 [Schaalia georgiae F0490]
MGWIRHAEGSPINEFVIEAIKACLGLSDDLCKYTTPDDGPGQQ